MGNVTRTLLTSLVEELFHNLWQPISHQIPGFPRHDGAFSSDAASSSVLMSEMESEDDDDEDKE